MRTRAHTERADARSWRSTFDNTKNMNKSFPICVLILFLTAPSQSEQLVAARACELEPVESALTYHTPEYYPNIRKVLFSKVEGSAQFQFLSLSSFSPEYLLSVSEDSDGNYYGQTLSPEKQIWSFSGDVTNIVVTRGVDQGRSSTFYI